MPLPPEVNPRVVFERLFGEGGSLPVRQAQMRKDRSILDAVTEEVTRSLKGLDPSDRAKLSEYLDAIRDIERRIQIAEEQSARELPVLERPVGVPDTLEEYGKLMFDLLVLAYQADLTRVSTFMIAHELSVRTYPEIGVNDPHHPVSHHRGDPKMIEKVLKIDTFHTKLFAYFLEKMQSTKDGNGSLLDHSMLVYGSGISDGNLHYHDNLPVLLAGGGAGQFKAGRHIRYPKGTPMSNLFVTMLEKLGMPAATIGDSTGKLELA